MRKILAIFALSAAFATGCYAKPQAASPDSILPLRSLRLYETGVGYYERTGTITQNTSLPVPAGHLDDALKSLVVLTSDGKSSVHGLEFSSSVSRGMARALAGLPLDAATPVSYKDLLSSLKGATVDVATSKAVVRGRIIDVLDFESQKVLSTKDGKDSQEEHESTVKTTELIFLLLTDDSEILRFRAEDVLSVRPTDPAFSARLGSALDALSQRGAQTRRMLRVLASSSTPVTLGYIAETPLWRSTYRLVLDSSGKKGTLQGWALVHNDTDEDWRDISVQLVNGRPDSFLYPLAAPRYSRRPLVRPENQLSTVPQLLDTTVDAIWGDHIEGEGIGLGSIGTIGHGSGTGSGQGFGSGSGRIGSVSRSEKLSESSLLEVGSLANVAQATGVEAGSLFFYSLAERLTLRAHGSALVPFTQQALDVQEITWINGSSGSRSAVRLVNTSRQTLPAGTIAVFAAGGFAGESAMDRLKPGEKSFIDFGVDLDLEMTQLKSNAVETVKRYTFANDYLQEHFVRRREITFEIENRSTRKRTVHRTLDVVMNAKVTGTDSLDFNLGENKVIGVFQIEATKKVERKLVLEEGLSRAISTRNLSSARLKVMSEKDGIKPEEKSALTEASTRQKELEETNKSLAKTKADMTEVQADITRLREHLHAMSGEKGGQAPGTNPFVQRILTAEDNLKSLRRKLESLEGEEKLREEAIKAALQKLAVVTAP